MKIVYRMKNGQLKKQNKVVHLTRKHYSKIITLIAIIELLYILKVTY